MRLSSILIFLSGMASGLLLIIGVARRKLHNTEIALCRRIDAVRAEGDVQLANLNAANLSNVRSMQDKYDNDISAILSSWCEDAARRNRDLEALRAAHEYVIERRRAEQLEFLRQAQSSALVPETNSPLAKALSLPTPPDLSLGVVFVKRDLSSRTFHHSSRCTDGLVRASRVFANALDMTPCPCALRLPPPDADELVYIASPQAKAYHRAGCHHLSGALVPPTQLLVRNALAKGLHPCSACQPPKEPVFRILF